MSKHLLQRRDFLRTIGAGAVSFVLPGCTDDSKPPGFLSKAMPNFIFILVDDLGWKDVGFMGSKYYESPNIDRLAGQGMVFTSAYANAPNCAPSRACILSGQYTPRHGIYTVGSPERGQASLRKLIPVPNKRILDPEVVTLAEALKAAGYSCASIGKWHLGKGEALGPRGQGFDLNVAGNSRGNPASYFSPYNNNDLTDGPNGEDLTDRLTEEALGFIQANRNNPFFLYLPYYAVHTPLQAKKELIDKYEKKAGGNGQSNPVYAAMVENTDRGVGRIMSKLEELNLAEDTVVFFFSDNGGAGKITSNEPLRGAKGMLYEGGIRVPLVIRWPGRVEPGNSCDTPVIGSDFYPTILEMAGVGKPSGHVLDGESLLPLLAGAGSLKREAIFWHFPAYLEGDSYQGAKDLHFRTRPAGAVRRGEWKLIEYFEDGQIELYNLEDDIGEKRNLAAEMPGKADELRNLLVRWRNSAGAPVPRQLNPEYDPVGE